MCHKRKYMNCMIFLGIFYFISCSIFIFLYDFLRFSKFGIFRFIVYDCSVVRENSQLPVFLTFVCHSLTLQGEYHETETVLKVQWRRQKRFQTIERYKEENPQNNQKKHFQIKRRAEFSRNRRGSRHSIHQYRSLASRSA